MKHCTCSCDENVEDTPIYSFFASSNKLVSFYYKIETAFKKKGHNKGLCKGNKVYVRERLRNMKHQFQYTDPNATKHPNKFMYRSAHIISINVSRKSVFISFLGAIKGDYEVQLYNICNATFVKYNLSTVICRLKLTSRRSYHSGLQTCGPWVSRPCFNFARVFHTQNNCDSNTVTNILPILGTVI